MREGLIYVLIALVAWGIYFGFSSYSCGEKARLMGKTHDYGVLTGCMILHKGEWVPLNSYRSLD